MDNEYYSGTQFARILDSLIRAVFTRDERRYQRAQAHLREYRLKTLELLNTLQRQEDEYHPNGFQKISLCHRNHARSVSKVPYSRPRPGRNGQ